jgi:outer membrane lipoprotein SlyB
LHDLINQAPVLHEKMPNDPATGQEDMMRKIIFGFLGLVLGGAVGSVVGGPLMVVVAAGLGALAAYYVGSRFEPVTAGRNP